MGRCVHDVPSFPRGKVVFHSIADMLRSTSTLGLSVSRLTGHLRNISFSIVTKTRSENFVFKTPLTCIVRGPFMPVHGGKGLPYRAIRGACSLRCNATAVRVRGSTIGGKRGIMLLSSLVTANKAVGTTTRLMRRLNNRIMGVLFLVRLDSLGKQRILGSCSISSIMRFRNGWSGGGRGSTRAMSGAGWKRAM